MSKGGIKLAHVMAWGLGLAGAALPASGARAQAGGPLPRAAPEPGSRALRYVSAQAYFQAMRAEILLAQGDRDGAAEALALALVYDPESYRLHIALARTALELGRGARVDRLVEQAIRLAPRRAAAWRLRGDAHRAANEPDAAARAYTRALTVEPASADGVAAAVALAELEVGRGREARAREVVGKVADRSPQGALARIRFELGRGELAAASQAAELGWARFPDDEALTEAAIAAHARAGRFERAWMLAAPAAVREDAADEALVAAYAAASAAGHGPIAASLGARLEARGMAEAARARLALASAHAGDLAAARALLAGVAAGARESSGQRAGDRGAVAGGRGADGGAPPGRSSHDDRAGELQDSAARPESPPEVPAAPYALADVILGVRSEAELHERLGRTLWVAGDETVARPLLSDAPALRVSLAAMTGGDAIAEARRAVNAARAGDPLMRAWALAVARAEGVDAGLRVLVPIEGVARVAAAAEIEVAGGRLDPAIARLEAARAIDADAADGALASIHARYGSAVRAERLAERMSASPSADPAVVALLGRLRVARKARLPETAARVARALGASPDDPELLGAYGRLAIALGREEVGARILARSAWIEASDPVVLEHLGDARAREGDEAGARRAYARAEAAWGLRERLGEEGAPVRRARVAEKLRR